MADIIIDRSAPPQLNRLRLSTLSATAGIVFTAEIIGATPGSRLSLTGNPGNRWILSGTTLTGERLSRGVETPAITEYAGGSGALGGPRETEFAVQVAHDPTIAPFVRSTTSTPPTPAVPAPTAATFSRSQLPLANRVYQRQTRTGGGQNKGQGTIATTINVTVPGAIYARTRASDGTTVSQASWLIGTVSATGAQTLNVTGVDARKGQFYLDLSGDGTTWQAGTVLVSMGALSLFAGQSLIVNMVRGGHDDSKFAANGVTVDPNGFVFADMLTTAVPTAWALPDDTTNTRNSAGLAEYLRLLVALTGVSCGVIGNAEGSTPIEAWLPGQARGDTLLATLDAAGGGAEIEWWWQGHNNSAAGTTYSSYQASLTTYHAGLAAHNFVADPSKIVTTIPNVVATNRGTPAQIEVIRRAADEWCAKTTGGISLIFDDLELTSADGIHELQKGAIRAARHAVRSLGLVYGRTTTDRGATLGRPTKSGVNLVMPYTLPTGATALVPVGDPSATFRVYPLMSEHVPANALALAASNPLTIDQTAKTITLALASDPGGVALDIVPHGLFPTAYDGSANQIYDNLLDGDGITYGRQLAAKQINLILPADRTLTVGGAPAFTTGKFGQAASGGYASAAVANMPSVTNGYTLEFWAAILASDPGNFRIMVSTANGLYTGPVGTSLRYNTAAALVDIPNIFTVGGPFVHIARIQRPGEPTETLYVNGNVAGTGDAPGRTNTGFGIRCYTPNSARNCTTDQLVDSVALWEGARWTAPFTPPTAPYAGNEDGLIAYYPLDGNYTNIAA